MLVAAGSGVITDIVRHFSPRVGPDVGERAERRLDGRIRLARRGDGDRWLQGDASRPPAGGDLRGPTHRVSGAGADDPSRGLLTRSARQPPASTGSPRTCCMGSHSPRGRLRSCAGHSMFAAEHTEEVLAGGEEAVGGLLTGLVQSGLAMALAGNSRPASGCEHHASHSGICSPAAAGATTLRTDSRSATRPGSRCGCSGSRSVTRRTPDSTSFSTRVPDPLGRAAREWLGKPSRPRSAARRRATAFRHEPGAVAT